jgi:hydrogenase maturation protein HypF
MENLETLDAFERALQHMQALFRCEPERIVCDSHPGYLSTRWARAYAEKHNLPLVEVQHHHAHAMSVNAEHGLHENETALTFAFDGTGYGTDGAIWGGEVLLARYDGFERLAHLKYVPLPGGDAAIRHPARVALAHLFTTGIDWTPDLPCVQACTATELRILQKQLTAGTHAVPTSSIGRLFDAVAAFLNIRRIVSYEGQAAIELEALSAQSNATDPYPVNFTGSEFDVAPMWTAMLQDLRANTNPAQIAARFHQTIVAVILHYSRRARAEVGYETVALTGGVFQNIHLLNAASMALATEGFRVLTHRLVPPNDGGIALGQAMINSSSHA